MTRLLKECDFLEEIMIRDDRWTFQLPRNKMPQVSNEEAQAA
jgi:hypothetical protein